MTWWFSGGLFVLALVAGDLELDCGEPGQARDILGRLMLAEIEGAEDIHRELMWQAFGRCPAGRAGEPCRERERRRFDAQWDRQKRQIEAKYRGMLSDFEERCRSSISLSRPSAYWPREGGG
jgi:hypothetical protein